MPFVKQAKKTVVNGSKSNMSHDLEIMAKREKLSALENFPLQLNLSFDEELSTSTIILEKPKRKRRRRRGTASHLVSTWRTQTRQRKAKTSTEQSSEGSGDYVNGGRIIKRRRRQNVNLTSPQRASLRQLLSKQKIAPFEPMEWVRMVEYAQNPDINRSDCNKIVFTAALDLLPSAKSVAEEKSDTGLIFGDFEAICETSWVHHRKFKSRETDKKRIETIMAAWTAVVLNKDQILGNGTEY